MEFIKYGICGGIATCINLALFVLFYNMHLHYLLANSLSYLLAVIINYICTKKYVFQTKSMGFPLMITEFLKFLGVRLLSLAVENFLLYVAAEWLCIHIYIGKAGVGIFMILAVFFINKYFVFTRK